ncbi:MAG: SpoIIE family protein phosphatase [Halanaerobiales bacterium]
MIKNDLSQLIIDNSPVGISITNEQGKYIYVNDAYCKIFGFAKSEILDSNFAHVLLESRPEYLQDIYNGYTGGIDSDRRNQEVVKKNSEKINILSQTRSIIGEDGSPLTVNYVIDVTKETGLAKDLNFRLRFERLMTGLATYINSLNIKEYKNGISHILEETGKFAGADYATVFVQNIEDKFDREGEWFRKETGEGFEGINISLMENLPSISKLLKKGVIVNIDNIIKDNTVMGSSEKQILLKLGIRSMFIYPIKIAENISAKIIYIKYLEFKDWLPQMEYFVKIIAELIHSLIIRKRNNYKIKEYTWMLENINDKLSSAYKKLNDEVKKARDLHYRFLPKKWPENGRYKFSSYYFPSEYIGGDFYNYIDTEDYIIFYLVDITGHGIDGAMLNIFVRDTINHYVYAGQNKTNGPYKLIQHILQKYFQENFPQDYFISIIVGSIEKNSGILKLCNSGIQVPPFLIEANGKILRPDSMLPPITNTIDLKIYDHPETENTFLFKGGSTLFITTDGLTEAKFRGEMIGEDWLYNVLEKNHDNTTHQIKEKVNNEFLQHTGGLEGDDDISYLIVKSINS